MTNVVYSNGVQRKYAVMYVVEGRRLNLRANLHDEWVGVEDLVVRP